MIPFESLLGQVSQAVQSAGGAVRQTECSHFLNWFEAGEGGALTPKAAQFRLTGDKAVDVPLVALVNHNSLGLTGVRLSMNITAKDDGGALMVAVDKPEEGEGVLSHKLELEFGKVAPAEGTARILNVENQFL